MPCCFGRCAQSARQGMSSFERQLPSRGIIQRLLRNLLVPCALSATWDKMMGLFWGKKTTTIGEMFHHGRHIHKHAIILCHQQVVIVLTFTTLYCSCVTDILASPSVFDCTSAIPRPCQWRSTRFTQYIDFFFFNYQISNMLTNRLSHLKTAI